MNLNGVFLFEYGIKDTVGCQLSVLADNSEFAASLNFLDINKVNDKLRRLPDMDSMIEDNDAAKPYKLMYKCNSDFKDLNYPEFFIEDINSKRGNFSVKDVDTLYEYNANKKPYIPYDAILYSLKDQDTEYIFIYKLGIRALLSNHRVYFGKLIVLNTSKVNSEKVHETTIFGATDKLLSMPTDIKDCIAVLKIKENDDKHELGVFKPLEYNSLFKDYKKRKEIARNNIDKFNDGSFKIADGMSVKISGDFSECIDIMNRAKDGGAFVISVDVPSGLNSDTGENMCKRPVAADITVTFGYAKTGFYMGYGYGNCGEIRVKDIGYPEGILPEDEESRQDVLYMQEDSDIQAMRLSERDIRANKSDYGKLVIAAGFDCTSCVEFTAYFLPVAVYGVYAD